MKGLTKLCNNISYLIYTLAFTIVICFASEANAYSVLTHEAIIDANWKTSIEPEIRRKFPVITPEQLKDAHAYAYGGAIIPDIGYFPFGSKLFTNMVHYIRTGDFVTALLEEAKDVNEYAFALGVLAHYMGDNFGHEIGTNHAVPLVYPKIKKKFGSLVTYADDHKSHSRMELGFDVLQIARGNYASQAYHDFIGFNISKPVLQKAFFRTYGIDVDDVFGSTDIAFSSFRWSVKTLIPVIVKSAWVHKKDDIRKINSGITARKFSYKMKRRMYYQEFGKDNKKAGFIPTLIAVLTPVLPKIGPLAKLKFKTPTPEAEKLFVKSFDTVLVNYSNAIKNTGNTGFTLANKCLDTGHKTEAGDYLITDDSYDDFLLKLKAKKFDNLKAEVRANLVSFYSNRKPPKSKKSKKKYAEVIAALEELKHTGIVGTEINAGSNDLLVIETHIPLNKN